MVDELFDKLDEIAPDGFYFAAHPDDGACYGFWEVDPNESKKSEKKDDYALFFETRVPGELTGARMFLTDMWNKMGNKKPRITFETEDPDFDSFVSHPNARVFVCGDTRSIASYARYLLAHYDEIPKDFEGRWVWKDDLAYFARGFKESLESKKPEACNGGKKDDKKDGKAAESKKCEKVIVNWDILERVFRSLLGKSITDARHRLDIAGWELIRKDVSGTVWEFSDGYNTIRVIGDPVNRVSLLGDTPYSIALPTINNKAAESKKSEGVIGIGGTMYASKLKSLARKLGSFGFKVSDNVEVKDENANDKSAEYNLFAEKDGKSYKINVDIYEGKHTTITLRDGATNAYISHLGEGSSFASAVSVIDADSVKSESKKSEGIGDHIKMNIDYNTFMRLLDAAAYLEADDDYKDALWEYFSEFGELDGDACEFFDNLFQYTDWYTAEEVWENYDNILGTKPEDKDAEEALDAYLEEHGDDLGGASVYKHGDHYLILQ